MSKLIKINPVDNVLVIFNSIVSGDEEEIEGYKIIFNNSFEFGHKIAAKNILKGEKIIKFGVPIGSALENIKIGAHVHLHNLKSDYVSTYTLDNEFIKSE